MKKNTSILIVVIVLLVVIIGGFIIFHKSPSNTSTSYNSTSTNSTTSPSTSSNSSTQSNSVNNAVLTTKSSSSLGSYLTDSNGNPLYTYGGDTAGVSNCTGSCLSSWPAYQDKGSTTGLPTNVGTIKRSDNGQIQYTYKGMPLYTFVGDSSGQPTGNGVSNFQIAKP